MEAKIKKKTFNALKKMLTIFLSIQVKETLT